MGRLYHDETDSHCSRVRRAWTRRRAWGLIVMLAASLALLPAHARTAPPARSDATPAPGVTVDLETLVDSLTWGKDLVQGGAPAGALIEVLLDEDVNATTLADATGQWRAAVLFATPGSHEFEVRARDANGDLLDTFGPMTIIVPAHALGQATATATLTATGTLTSTSVPTPAPGWRTALGVVANAVIRPPGATVTPAAATATTAATVPPTHTPTPSPVPTATPTATASPSATATPLPTMTPTWTPLPTATPTATATSTPAPPTATASPAALESASGAGARQSSPRHRGQPSTPAAMAAVPVGNVRLVSPDDMESGYGRRTFAWEADFALPPGLAFELVFWHENQDPLATGFGLAPPTRATSLSVDLNQLDHDLGNLLQPGLYRWGVLLVQVAPYQRLAFLGDSHRFRFDRTYGHRIEPLHRESVGDQVNAELVVASHPHDLGVDGLGPRVEHTRPPGGQSPRADGRNRPVAAAALLAAGRGQHEQRHS